MDPRGRSCPLAYRYQPEALAQPGVQGRVLRRIWRNARKWVG